MRYFATTIGILIFILYVYYNAGTGIYAQQYFLIQKAQLLSEKELQKYIKTCNDGYYYFAHQVESEIVNKKARIVYERITDYDITIIPTDESGNTILTGMFTTKNQAIYKDGRWEIVYEDIIEDNPLRLLFQITNEDEVNIVNPFETAIGYTYIPHSDFNCPNKK